MTARAAALPAHHTGDDNALDRELCYRALRTRDARFDGRFFTGVLSTGIYCRPICPARTPKLENCLFLPSAAAAQRLGFRPCLRCRPEAAPGHAVARGTLNTVSRALQLIADGQLASGELESFSGRLGIGTRQLRRLFDRHVGASPVQVAQTQRMLLAKQLLSETSLPISQVALAAGFGSVRRFNAAFRRTYERAPSELRTTATRRRTGREADPIVEIRLSYAPPYDFRAMLEFLEPRAIPGVERVQDGEYQRAFRLGNAFGSIAVRDVPEHSHLIARIRCTEIEPLGQVVARLRRLFDLDADSRTIDAQLSQDALLAERVRARPGVRVPGAWDHFELAVRAVLGQQVSVSAATTFAARIAQQYGTPLPESARLPRSARSPHDPEAPTGLFPEPKRLAQADFKAIGLTGARIVSLQSLARAVCTDEQCLQPAASLEDSVTKLCALPGIGPWTAQYIAMRALREPDAFPLGDLGLIRALFGSSARVPARAMELRAQLFRPFRAYACMRLWLQPA